MNSILSRVARLHTVCCTIMISMKVPGKHVMQHGTTDFYRRRIRCWGVLFYSMPHGLLVRVKKKKYNAMNSILSRVARLYTVGCTVRLGLLGTVYL